MPTLLHIDSSIQGDKSISRLLTARAVEAWKAANPDGTVVYRDLHANPLPVLNSEALLSRYVPQDQYDDTQAKYYALSKELTDEIKAADTVVSRPPALQLRRSGVGQDVVDHIVFPGLSTDPATSEGLLGGRKFIALASRGGGYAPGTPREGWDHASPWLVHVLSTLGLEVDVIAAELTLAEVVPAMAELKGLADESLKAAEAQIDALFGAPVAG